MNERYTSLDRTSGGVVLWACRDCGCVAFSRTIHDAWHQSGDEPPELQPDP